MKQLLLAAVMFAATTLVADAQDKFIAAYGSGASCTMSAPCNSLAAAGSVIEGASIYTLTPGSFGSAVYQTGVNLVGPGDGATLGSVEYEPTARNVRIMNMNFANGTNQTTLRLRGQDSVLIENVTFTQTADTGGYGIYFVGGSSLTLRNVSFHNASGGPGAAIRIMTFGVSSNISLENVQVSGGSTGLSIDTSSGGFARVSVKNSTFSNIEGSAVSANAGSGKIRLYIDDVTMTTNGNGLVASGSNVIGWMGETTIAGNNIGVQRTGGANIMSFKNNYIYNNNTDGIPLPNTWSPPAMVPAEPVRPGPFALSGK